MRYKVPFINNLSHITLTGFWCACFWLILLINFDNSMLIEMWKFNQQQCHYIQKNRVTVVKHIYFYFKMQNDWSLIIFGMLLIYKFYFLQGDQPFGHSFWNHKYVSHASQLLPNGLLATFTNHIFHERHKTSTK